MLPVTTLLAFLSPALTLMRSVPQGVRIARAGAEGVSEGTWMGLFLIAELWAAYGVLARIPAEVATNVPNGLLCLAVVLLAARRRGSLGRAALAAAGLTVLAAAFVACCVLARAEGVESSASVAGSLVMYLPQVAKVLRARSLAGVSLFGWATAFLAAVSWGAYGLLIHKVPVFLPNLVTGPAAFVIALQAGRSRRLSTALHYR